MDVSRENRSNANVHCEAKNDDTKRVDLWCAGVEAQRAFEKKLPAFKSV